MQGWGLIETAVATVGLVAAITASGHALLYKRRPQSAFGWIALCFSLPLAGPLLYYFFGINRIKTRARKLLTSHPAEVCPTEHIGTPPRRFEALGRLRHTCLLTRALWGYLFRNSMNEISIDLHRRALAAAEALGDDDLTAMTHNYLASAYARAGGQDDLHPLINEAFDLVEFGLRQGLSPTAGGTRTAGAG